jgi:glutamate carboxypeptidase
MVETVVNQDSPSTSKKHCDAVAEIYAEKARRFGYEVELDPQTDYGDNLVARLAVSSPDGRSPVLLVGHMDTVFETDTTNERPFTSDGVRAYGPGIFDMKAGLVIGLYAVKCAMELADEWHTPITYIFNTDEEPGSPCSRVVIEREAPGHQVALILEPGQDGPALTVGRKGVAIFEVTTEGRAAHAGVEPEKGINSIVDLAARIARIAALADPVLGTSVNVGVVTGGTQPYVVPSRASCRIDVRVPTLMEQARIEKGLRQIVGEPGVPGAVCSLGGGFHRPPFEPTEASRAYLKILQDFGEQIGYPIGAEISGGASDGNLTARAGLPTIDGLGAQGGYAHRPDEFIDIDSLVSKAALLCGLLLDINARD